MPRRRTPSLHNVVGYSIYGDYREPNPRPGWWRPSPGGEVDVAVIWGPLAGYFAPRQPVPLEIVPVSPVMNSPALPFVFDISMGVRRDDTALQERLDAILEHKRASIQVLLAA